MSNSTPVIYSTERYQYLADAVCRCGDFILGKLERKAFPDGERYLRLHSTLVGCDVSVIGGTVSDQDTLELYDLAYGAVQYGARTVTLVVPYFGYSTMERAMKMGEVVTAKTRARLLSSIPRAYHTNRVLLLDLHTEGITHYFEGALHTEHLSARRLVARVAQEVAGDDFVVACTDAGRAKWVQRLANDLGQRASFIIKHRASGTDTEVVAVSAHVSGRKVVIYDDMIRTGGSLVGAAAAYRDAGATDICAIVTHGVFPGDALARIEESGLFRRIICTDSHPRAMELQSNFLKIESIAPLISRHLAMP